MATWEVREGDALERLRELPVESVQCCVTSPPYFGLRDYGIDGQIGLERSPDEFVARLVDVFREVRRVLRSDGTLWLNIGDSYAGSWGAQSRKDLGGAETHPDAVRRGMTLHDGAALKDRPPKTLSVAQIAAHPKGQTRTGSIPTGADYKAKDLLGIPWLLAFALRADGWYLRSDVIWAKPNPMPESVTDRPTSAHEHVFLLAKSARYAYDADAIREPHAMTSWSAQGDLAGRTLKGQNAPTPKGVVSDGRAESAGIRGVSYHPDGRNKRNVWEVATQPYADAHFATFPPKLIEPCILAGSSPKACGECGAPWERVVERERLWKGEVVTGAFMTDAGKSASAGPRPTTTATTLGWQSSCGHDDDTGRSVILDPFAGAGTTGLVALRHDRSFIGIELNSSYAEMARERIRQDAPLLNTPAEGETWQPQSLTVPSSSA